MKTTFREDGKDYVMEFEGRLDTAAASQTEKDVEALNDCMGHNIILDCNKLDYISSSGLRIFLTILKNAKSKGSHVYITGLSNELNRVFAMTGFTSLFEYK
jgi:anti-anti-sigma factor